MGKALFVCVREIEREIKRERERGSVCSVLSIWKRQCVREREGRKEREREKECVYMCVCVFACSVWNAWKRQYVCVCVCE